MSTKNRWEIPNRIPQDYKKSLKKFQSKIMRETKGISDPDKLIQKLKDLTNSKEFEEYAYRSAMSMVDNVYKHGRHRWRLTVLESPAGRKMYEVISKELTSSPVGTAFYKKVAENAKYISSVPKEAANNLTKKVESLTRQGLRSQEISDILQNDYPGMLKSRLDLIARTEASKTQTALTQARAENLGMGWYIWRTSEDSRVRTSHNHMDGVLVRWSDPPSPEALAPSSGQKPYGNYHAGDTFNCRCYPEPIVDLDFVTFPCKVYYGGKIQTMTRSQFEQIAA